MYYYDPTIIYIFPVIILSMFFGFLVKSRFKKYSKFKLASGMTGAQATRILLDKGGLGYVKIERVGGTLSDHYAPKTKTIRLSEDVYDSKSISAVSVAAHEVGHAFQDAESYALYSLRDKLAVPAMISTQVSNILLSIGLLLTIAFRNTSIGMLVLKLGLILFVVVFLFNLVTLPLEINASRRAIRMLGNSNIINADEEKPAKKVLTAAALTYFSALLYAFVNILRVLSMINRD